MLSFEIAAERCEDLTPLVYHRLFLDWPELEALFWREPVRQIQGEMLAKAIEALFDFIGERRYADMMISNEAVTHDGYEVPPEIFGRFFPAIRQAVRDLLNEAWTQAMDTAWDALIAEIDGFIARAFPGRTAAGAPIGVVPRLA